MNTNELAYIAGLFDGEGCVTCKQKATKRKDRNNKVYNQWYIRCELAMTDKDTVEWTHKTLDNSIKVLYVSCVNETFLYLVISVIVSFHLFLMII